MDGSPEASSKSTRKHRYLLEVTVALLRDGCDTKQLLLLLLAPFASSAVLFVPCFRALLLRS